MAEREHKIKRKIDKKPEESQDKSLPWWLIALGLFIAWWGLDVNNDSLWNISWWWYIACCSAGMVVGIVRLARDKEIVWNWTEYLGSIYYVFVYTAIGMMISVLLIFGVEIVNSYVPTDNPYYDAPATISYKSTAQSYRGGRTYTVLYEFDNERLGTQRIDCSPAFYNAVKTGELYIFTLQNGCLGIPVIRNMRKGE